MATNNDILAALNEVIDKLDGLCGCLDIEVHPPQITIPGGGGFEPEQPPITQGDPPPAGAFQPDSSITDRKCKAANMIVDNITAYTESLSQTIDFDNVLILDFSSLGALLSSLSAAIGTYLSTLSAQLGGWLSQVAAFIVGQNFSQADIDDLVSKLKNNKSALVCALYNAQSATAAKSDFLAVLTLSAQQQTYLGYFLNNTALNLLFVAQLGSEAQLSNYSSTVDCAVSCGGCQNIWIFKGNQSGNSITAEFQPSVSLYQIEAFFNYDGGQHCGGNVVIDVTVTSGTAYWEAGGEKTFRCRNQSGNQIYNSHTPPAGVSCGQIYFWSTTAFTIDLITT